MPAGTARRSISYVQASQAQKEVTINAGLDLIDADLAIPYAGNPNSHVTGSPGDLCRDTTDGRLYVKGSGVATNTGWLAVSTAAGISSYAGNPNSHVIGNPGDLVQDTTDGTLYVKNSGTGTNTGWLQLSAITTAAAVDSFAGNPNSNVTGNPGDLCQDTTDGTLYVKATGTGTNTGWVVVSTISGITSYAGNPNGNVNGNVGDLVRDTTGGNLYLKTSGAGTNTGWTALSTGASVAGITTFAGNPNSNVNGNVGDLCRDTTDGTLYVKNTGAGTNTGWIVLSSEPTVTTTAAIQSYAGNPNSHVNGSPGDLVQDTTDGTLYLKTSGSGTNTGWSAVTKISTTAAISSFAGNPNSNVVGSPGDLCQDTTGGNLYLKTSGTATNTGWTALPTSSGSGASASVGTYASLPAAGTAGRTYYCTDAPVTLVDDGSAWHAFAYDYPVTLPVLTDWNGTHVTNGSGTGALAQAGPFIRQTLSGTASNTLNVDMWCKTWSGGSTPFTFRCLFFPEFSGDGNERFGICFRNTSTLRFTGIMFDTDTGTFAFAGPPYIRVNRYSSTAISANLGSTVALPIQLWGAPSGPVWLQIRFDGTNMNFEYSRDLQTWTLIVADALSNFQSAINQIGFFIIKNNSGSGAQNSATARQVISIGTL